MQKPLTSQRIGRAQALAGSSWTPQQGHINVVLNRFEELKRLVPPN